MIFPIPKRSESPKECTHYSRQIYFFRTEKAFAGKRAFRVEAFENHGTVCQRVGNYFP